MPEWPSAGPFCTRVGAAITNCSFLKGHLPPWITGSGPSPDKASSSPTYMPLLLGSSVLTPPLTSACSTCPRTALLRLGDGTRFSWVNARRNLSFGSSTIGRHRGHKPRNGGSFRKNLLPPAAGLRMGKSPGGGEAKPEIKAGSRTWGMRPGLRQVILWKERPR